LHTYTYILFINLFIEIFFKIGANGFAGAMCKIYKILKFNYDIFDIILKVKIANKVLEKFLIQFVQNVIREK